MFKKLQEIFEAIGLEYVRQGSFAEDAKIPSSYFSYWNTESPLDSYYDNHETRVIWRWNIYFYTSDPALIYSKMDEFLDLARDKGFVVEDRGSDIPSDLPNYFGRMTQVTYVEKQAYKEE